MKDHTGCRRGFIWTSQAYYAKTALATRDVLDNITIGMYHPEGGTTGEFTIEWTELGGRECAQLKAYDDSWSALQLFGDVLAKVAEHDDAGLTPAQLAELLLSCGVVDLTDRVGPDHRQGELVLSAESMSTRTIRFEGGIADGKTSTVLQLGAAIHVPRQNDSGFSKVIYVNSGRVAADGVEIWVPAHDEFEPGDQA